MPKKRIVKAVAPQTSSNLNSYSDVIQKFKDIQSYIKECSDLGALKVLLASSSDELCSFAMANDGDHDLITPNQQLLILLFATDLTVPSNTLTSLKGPVWDLFVKGVDDALNALIANSSTTPNSKAA